MFFQDSSDGYKCEFPGCSAVLRYKRGYNEHINRHMGKYPYECPYCNKGLSGATNTKRHLKKYHTGLFGYHCVTCGMEFENVRSLKVHLDSNDCSVPNQRNNEQLVKDEETPS